MKKYIFIIILIIVSSWSCNDFMDVIPDNIATIDNIFGDRTQAEKYLFTCYYPLPPFSTNNDPGMVSGDGVAHRLDVNNYAQPGYNLMLRGNNVSSPIFNYWGTGYAGIRFCNTFLENIDRVPGMDSFEKARWVAEVKVLKAFYHFWLLQMYGPIPIIRENLPIDATPEEVAVHRDPVDDVVDYIVQLIDEATPNLPLWIENEVSELGRITQPVALTIKAKVLVTAASPLFNGNTAYSQFKDNRGVTLFNQDTSEEAKRQKWEKAAVACKNAIDTCLMAGHELYEFSTLTTISEDTRKVVQSSQIVTDKWNKEQIWGGEMLPFGANNRSLQAVIIPPLDANHIVPYVFLHPTLKMAEMFYTKNGVPIDEDKEYDYEDRYTLQGVEPDDTYHRYFMQSSRTTVQLHYNREPRFYGSLGVDGGYWFGMGRNTDDTQWPLNVKFGQGVVGADRCTLTGYYIKKLSSYLSAYSGQTFVQNIYSWPIFRMADLYLLYAEALNESIASEDIPDNSEVYYWVDQVRARAGLNGVKDSWDNYSKHPDRYKTKTGMRGIIHRERSIELMFEGQRFWDLRRWGLAIENFRQPIQGWNVVGASDAEFYTVRNLDYYNYSLRDILWPIQESEIQKNPNLIQNPGW